MELLPFLFMSSCFLTLSRLTFGDESGKPVIVRGCDDAILPCSLGTNENIEFVRFEWKKEGTEKKVFTYDTGMVDSPALADRVSHFRDDLKNGNASIKIKNAQLKDRGNYTCNFPTRGKTFRIELVVGTLRDRTGENLGELSGGKTRDAVSKPIVSLLNGEGSLQCEVQSKNPEPTVEWWDNNGNKIQSDEPQKKDMNNHKYIIVKTTVTKSGNYRCVATQKDICHEIFAETFVPVGGFSLRTVGVIGGIAVGVVVVILLVVCCWKKC